MEDRRCSNCNDSEYMFDSHSRLCSLCGAKCRVCIICNYVGCSVVCESCKRDRKINDILSDGGGR